MYVTIIVVEYQLELALFDRQLRQYRNIPYMKTVPFQPEKDYINFLLEVLKSFSNDNFINIYTYIVIEETNFQYCTSFYCTSDHRCITYGITH